MGTHSSSLAWKITWTEKPGMCEQWAHKELDTTEQLTLSAYLPCLQMRIQVQSPEGAGVRRGGGEASG